MATFLLRRIGYIDAKEDKSYGMCASVLKSCQDYTYTDQTSNKQYKVDNEVIRQYLAVALTKVKLRQDEILSEYAEDCWNDVYSCLATNNYDETDETSTASKIAVGACRGEISTCMSVTGYYPSDAYTLTLSAMANWVTSKTLSCDEDHYINVTYGDNSIPHSIASVACEPCPADMTSEGGQTSVCQCPGDKVLKACSNGSIQFGLTKYQCVDAGGGVCDVCGYALVAPNSGTGYVKVDEYTTGEKIELSRQGATDKYAGVKLTLNSGTNECECPTGLTETLDDEDGNFTTNNNDFKKIFDANGAVFINTGMVCKKSS